MATNTSESHYLAELKSRLPDYSVITAHAANTAVRLLSPSEVIVGICYVFDLADFRLSLERGLNYLRPYLLTKPHY